MKTFDQTILLVPDTGFRMFFFPLGPDPFGVIDPEIRAMIIANRAASSLESIPPTEPTLPAPPAQANTEASIFFTRRIKVPVPSG